MSVLSFLGDIVGGMFGMSAQHSANQTNMELAKYAFDRNFDMWNKQNEYNAPVSQMERLKAAGLNPNLVYGSGSVVGNTSGSAPEYKAPSVNPVSNGGFISNAVQHGLFNDAQLRQINASTEYTKTQTSVSDAQIARVAAETAETLQRTAKSKFDLSLAEDLRKNSIDVANANLQNIKQSAEYTKVRTEVAEMEKMLIPLKSRLTERQISNLSVATEAALWELTLQKQGKFVGHDVLSQLANQIIRWSNDEPSLFDSVDKLTNKIQSRFIDKPWWQSSSSYYKHSKGSGVR